MQQQFRTRSQTSKSMLNFNVDDSWIGQIVCHKYKITKKLNQGSFGKVYSCIHIDTGVEYSVKIEQCSRDDKQNRIKETLLNEMHVLLALKGEIGFPRLQYFWKDNSHNIMITTLLGRNFDQFVSEGKLSLKAVTYFAIHAIQRIQFIHQKGFIHRDIKPENFVVGLGENQKIVYLLDYGLTKSFRTSTGRHIDFQTNVGMVGTVRYNSSKFSRYASPNCLKGHEQSRRDDMLSLGYTLIYLLTGTLPWMNLPIENKDERKQTILTMKITTPISQLCNQLPDEFHQYFNHCFALKFENTPNYKSLCNIFQELAKKKHFDFDDPWDCMKLEQRPSNLLPTVAASNTFESLDKFLGKFKPHDPIPEQINEHIYESMTSGSLQNEKPSIKLLDLSQVKVKSLTQVQQSLNQDEDCTPDECPQVAERLKNLMFLVKFKIH